MYSHIINPKTKRKVSIYGETGRKILRNYLIQLGGNLPNDSLQLTITFTDPDNTSNKIIHKEIVNGVTSKTKFIKPLGWYPKTLIEYNTDGEIRVKNLVTWKIIYLKLIVIE